MQHTKKTLWVELAWPELHWAAQGDHVVIVPIGSVEEHGLHLPVDTDISCAFEVAKRAAKRVERVLVAPPIWWGLSPEWQSFHGTIYLRLETLVNLLTDVCHAIVSHGFRKILLLNGHGGNSALIRAFSKELLQTHDVAVACADHWRFAAKKIEAIRRSGPGGMGHAGELETSLQLFFRPELVAMGQAQAAYPDPARRGVTSFAGCDMYEPGIVWILCEYPNDTSGDPTVATAETGAHILEAEIEELVAFVEEFRQTEAAPAMPI